jgi:hypothetical protein
MLIKSNLELIEYIKGNIKFSLNIEFNLYFEDAKNKFHRINCFQNAISYECPNILDGRVTWHYSNHFIQSFPLKEVNEQYISEKLRRAK